jgi:hypothetical protein
MLQHGRCKVSHSGAIVRKCASGVKARCLAEIDIAGKTIKLPDANALKAKGLSR